MSLGKTWWHGAIVKRQDSYAPDEGHPRARFDEAAWEATEAWNRKRGPLSREADALLRQGGETVGRRGFLSVSERDAGGPQPIDQDLLVALIAVILID